MVLRTFCNSSAVSLRGEIKSPVNAAAGQHPAVGLVPASTLPDLSACGSKLLCKLKMTTEGKCLDRLRTLRQLYKGITKDRKESFQNFLKK